MEELKQVRCPVCNKLLGKFIGKGVLPCPRCKGRPLVSFDTAKNKTNME